LGETYLSLTRDARRRFLGLLAAETPGDPRPVQEAIAGFNEATDQGARQHAERVLRIALRSPRVTLYRRFTALPQGVKFLVDLRADLLEFRREDPSLDVLEDELKSLLVSWFDVGFLELTRIEWDSPASLLEKLIHYEAVHRIQGWEDLKNRLRTDRRCFAFFHPRMPEEPFIFVWIELVKGMPDNIQTLLDASSPVLEADAADAALFYSISNAQAGLKGVSFGDFLIKRVADVLARRFPNLKTFSTLSPVPSFARWLSETLDEARDTPLLTASERKALGPLAREQDAETLRAMLRTPRWCEVPGLSQALKTPLLRLCATYLVREKRGTGFARDSVAHFHFANGARVERLNWLADTSSNGMRQSLGIMVNYRYKLSDIENNHERYKRDGVINASSVVRGLARKRG
ncbi:MAG: malonyl-CoA decarboxylase, partial [Acidobacteriota bacterium]|nr:malonyl-CoA decarboxylase [Acidobacteriota bacterium]